MNIFEMKNKALILITHFDVCAGNENSLAKRENPHYKKDGLFPPIFKLVSKNTFSLKEIFHILSEMFQKCCM